MVGAVVVGTVGVVIGAVGCSDDSASLCYGADRTYEVGAAFDDGCRSCTCNADTTITCVETAACERTCEDALGGSYDIGELWSAGDRCNVCQCVVGDAGAPEVSCTSNDCGLPCIYAGQQRPSGTSFPALDGCNTCTCGDDGVVGCTEMACACDAEAEWWRDYVGSSVEDCAVIDFDCPPNTTGFSNQCGCGCEQSSACAPSYDCAPPSTCDVQQIAADCPYSEILE